MQQFVVPQFIDVEDKVFGPITVRQFIIILTGAGINFIAYSLSDFALFIFWFVIISIITFFIAFIKVNGRPIHFFILNVAQTSRKPRLRVWQKIFSDSDLRKSNKKSKEKPLPETPRHKNTVRASRLAEMALIVDTGGVYQGEKEPPHSDQQLV